MLQNTRTLKCTVARLVCYNVANLIWYFLGTKKIEKTLTIGNAVVCASRSMKKYNCEKHVFWVGGYFWLLLVCYFVLVFFKEETLTFYCAT